MEEHISLRWVRQILIAIVLAFIPVGTVAAVTATSPSYQVTETQFNSGMTLDSCSGEYCAQASIGDIVSGRSTSSQAGTTTATFGTTLDEDPLLEVIVEPGESDLGVLTTEKTATKTTIVRIRSYLSDGYTLQIIGDPPKYGNHQLRTSATPWESSPGTEQFAINAVANVAPVIGNNPIQVPSNQTSFGEVEEGYGIPNFFKYRSGDVIARSLAESGRTDYTISMIVNVANNTPAGKYVGDYSAVVVPFY